MGLVLTVGTVQRTPGIGESTCVVAEPDDDGYTLWSRRVDGRTRYFLHRASDAPSGDHVDL